MKKIITLCKLVPMLPVVIVAAIPLALLGNWHPWGVSWWHVDPGIGEWVVILIVAYTIIDTLKGMIDDIRHGHVGVDILAVVALLSTLAVGEYWAAWAVTLMVYSGELIEEYAQSKAERNLTALMEAAPQIAHISNLPGVGHSAEKANAANNNASADSSESASASATSGTSSPTNTSASVDSSASVGTLGSAGIANTPNVSDAHNHLRTVPVEEVQLDDVLVVLPGETVPVDGTLLSGSATLDLSNINGEPVPREVFAGARVMSGAVNGSTALTMRATQLARDSQYQRILELVSSAQNSRPEVVKTADLMAVPFTVLSFVIAGVAWFVSGVPERFAQVLVLATPCPLLIAAPVAYIAGTGRLAKAGILIKAQEVLENLGRVSHVFFDKTGTLTVKQPQVVRVEMVDDAKERGFDENHVLMAAGIVESYSVHILAKGIANAGKKVTERLREAAAHGETLAQGDQWLLSARSYPVVKNVEEKAGKGVSAEIDGRKVAVGRFAFVTGQLDDTDAAGMAGTVGFGAAGSGAETGSAVDSGASGAKRSADGFRSTKSASGQSVGNAGGTTSGENSSTSTPAPSAGNAIFGEMAADEMAAYVSIDGVLTARIVMKDVPRANAKQSLAQLHALGVNRLSMVTGDKLASAQIIANEVGIDDVHAELFPEDKVAVIAQAGKQKSNSMPWVERMLARFMGENDGRTITMMIGDGVNDAPVLAAADIGIAMTDGTTTAASESAQVVIMNDDIASVPRAIAISRHTKRVMLQAVFIGLGLATVGMIAAAFNLIPVVAGAFMQEAIDVVSILWALTALWGKE